MKSKTMILCVALASLRLVGAQTNEPANDWKPAPTNQGGKEYPQVNSEGRVKFRIVAPEAKSVGCTFRDSSEFKKGDDGAWYGYTRLLDEGFHYYMLKIDGAEILIGKGARENDELTFGVAAPEDFWFHVGDYSGSHVVVRNPRKDKDLEESILVKAAQLAAYFSQARNSSKVEVHYTKRKHVTKPRRAKPGLVRLLEFKSIKVEPKNWLDE